MDRKNKILNHKLFNECYDKIEMAESARPFCRHNMIHFLDVARIAMILKEKEGILVEEDLIYAAALLHDIGRHIQYQDGTPHEIASAQISRGILNECGFGQNETGVILKAIQLHREIESAEEKNLNGLLYRADKMSRSCFICKAYKECKQKEDKKNQELIW